MSIGFLKTVLVAALLLAAAAFLSAAGARSDRWEVQYFYDQNESSLTLTDLKFPSAQRGIASGYIAKKVANLILGDRDKEQPVVLATSNGGKSWDQIATKATAESLFFLNDSMGWLVAHDGIWVTTESGRAWKRISNIKNLSQAYFLTATHGFAAGDADRVLETQDGGATWKPIVWQGGAVPAPMKISYHAIAFSDAQNAIIAGELPPAEEMPEDIPVRQLRPRKQVNAFLYTKDGGKTWRRSINSMYGEMTRVSVLQEGLGLALLQFPQSYPWPSEVFKLRLGTDDANHMQYRSHERAITDVLIKAGSDSYIAGYQPPGEIHPSPIPGKVKILRSADLNTWEDMAVDYRAVARQVWLASPEPAAVWAATDTGMILRLTNAK